MHNILLTNVMDKKTLWILGLHSGAKVCADKREKEMLQVYVQTCYVGRFLTKYKNSGTDK